MKYVWIGIAIFFAGSMLVGVAVQLLGERAIAVVEFAPLITLCAAIAIPIWMRRRTRRVSGVNAEAMVDQVTDWFRQLDANRKFVLYRPHRAVLRPDEFAILCGETNLLELVKPNARYYLGTRVKIGSLPIYLGGSARGNPQWKATDRGEVVVSNKRFLFVGGQRQISATWNDVVGIEPLLDGIIISISSHSSPIAVMVDNGLLWAEVCRYLAKMRIESNQLQAGAIIAPSFGMPKATEFVAGAMN